MREPRPAASVSILLSALLVFLSTALPALAVTVEEIPSPRPRGWSVDLTGRLSQERLAEIDRVGDEVRAKSGAEMAVVVVGSTDGVPSREIATRLFNRWGIGQSGKDNGVLLFLALDDHKAEVVLGNGFSNVNLREVSASILQGHMVPLLRQGDPGAAAVAGARAAAWQLAGVALTSPLPAPPGMEGASPLATPMPAPNPAPPATPAPVAYISYGGGSPGGFLGSGLVLAVLGLLGWGGYKLATRPRLCPKCQKEMTRLPEEAVAAHETPVEQLESRLGSVNTKIFQCPSCGELEKVRHRTLSSRYESCPACGAMTAWSNVWIVRQATYYEEGIEQTDWACENCDYRDSKTSWIARVVVPPVHDSSSSSWSSSSSYDSSSSSSSDSSGSSSSSDSGFSGGSSSGDGASASW